MLLTRRNAMAGGAALLGSTVPFASLRAAPSGEPIKVGILHSLTGTMAISETALRDVMLMLIDQQNRKGGLLGRPLEAVVVDPASDWPLFADKARQLIATDRVAAVFGCWTSVSRKSVLPVFKELNGLLFYPVQYEGEESERNVFYTGAAPNQQAIPAVEFLRSASGSDVLRWFLVGTDYVYPRTTNAIIEAYLRSYGVLDENIRTVYTPFGHRDWQQIVTEIKEFGSTGIQAAVISTVNGDANLYFYNELAKQGIDARELPVMAFSVGEAELANIDTNNLVRHLAAWNYFQTVRQPANSEFIRQWRTFIGNPQAVTNDPMEAHYIGFTMWVKAVERAQSTEVDKVVDAIIGVQVPNLSGGVSTMLPSHHITKPVMIGEIQSTGQFEIVWSTDLVAGDAWSDYLPESLDFDADWVGKKCGKFNKTSGVCVS